MMYYRKKCLLALFQVFGNSLGKTEFQKYLFLFSLKQKIPSYEFVPYKYGSFSFQAINDIKSLINNGYIKNDNQKWVLLNKEDYLHQLDISDIDNLKYICAQYGILPLNELIHRVYAEHPYYCKNSLIKNVYISANEIDKIAKKDKSPLSNKLFTIGYEGACIENYINRLVQNNIKLIIDIRSNPVSMKFGFSKNRLNSILQKMSIDYIHIPELGIPTEVRKIYLNQELKDYDGLFKVYKLDILPRSLIFLNKIYSFLQEKLHVALTCFEANSEMCHRKIVAEKIAEEYNENLLVNHI